MDPVQGLGGVFGTTRVQERAQGGNKRQADAFREALQQRTGSDELDGEASAREVPVRTGLQPPRQESRRGDGTSRHVDVIA
jgi:hypothetical protein